jgi:hypothetical protein
MIFVLILTWIRFLSLFLVIRSVSKILLTVYALIVDTLVFLLLAGCYLLIIASLFATVYEDNNPELYG